MDNEVIYMCEIVKTIKHEISILNEKEKFDKEKVEAFAQRILDEFRFNTVPISALKIAKKMDFDVKKGELDNNVNGIIAIDTHIKNDFPSEKLILLNENNSDFHQNFAIAHALAHYIFDYIDLDEPYYNTYYINGICDNVEKRANRFAAALLMPKNTFIEEYEKIKETDTEKIKRSLSSRFLVTRDGIHKRFIEVFGYEL